MASANDVLSVLRQYTNQSISGEQLSAQLGVSRSAIWKHIRNLETAGYKIEAISNKGYRLLEVPDKCLPDEIRHNLNTRIFGREIFAFNSTTSTNDRAIEMADNGAFEGTVVIAEHQTAGRGRLKRVWLDQPGKNLLFTIIFRPKWTVDMAPGLTQLMAISTARAISNKTGLKVSVKWPNDLLIDNKKVAGILTEMRGQADRVDYIIAGIGININGKVPEETRYPAISLMEAAGKNIQRTGLLRSILEETEKLYNEVLLKGMASIIKEWKNLSGINGAMVKVVLGNETIEGMVTGIDEHGYLLVRMESGLIKTVCSGEISQIKIS